MPTYLGSHPSGSSPITVFAGVGDFGAPSISMRGPAEGGFSGAPHPPTRGDYTAYPYTRDFGTGYLNAPRATSLGYATLGAPVASAGRSQGRDLGRVSWAGHQASVHGFGDAAALQTDAAAGGFNMNSVLAAIGAVTGNVETLLNAWANATGKGKEGMVESIARQTGMTPQQVMAALGQAERERSGLPAWVLPVGIGVGGIALAFGAYMIFRRKGKGR